MMCSNNVPLGSFLTLSTNIRLGRKGPIATNTGDYYVTELITVVKSFIGLALQAFSRSKLK
jgi:hypothetical protein